MPSKYRFFGFCLTMLLSAGLLLGQSTLGSITGIVKDTSGAVIPQAEVTLKSVHTGLQLKAETDSAGDYLFSNLQPGVYSVAVSHSGFGDVRSGNIVLIATQHARFDVTLAVGKTEQTVTVQATPPTLDTENGQLSSVVTQREILAMPLALGQRNDEIAFLNLQSSNYVAAYDTSLGGARDTSSNWTIDGISANSALFGDNAGNMVDEDIDAVQDIQANTSNNSAEYPQIGSIVISDRSGTNTFHGSLSEYENNWAFDARPFYSTGKPKGPTAHTFAGSIGGPVILPGYNGRDKTFFFFAYERHESPGVSVNTAQAPTAAMMQGDFSQLLPGTVIKNPATGQPFPNNTIPSGMISSVSQNLQKFGFLPPNHLSTFSSGYDWVGTEPTASHNSLYTGRVDHNIANKDHLFGRWSFQDLPHISWQSSQPLFYYSEVRTTNNGMIGETHSFSPSVLNEFRLGFSRDAANYGDSHKNGLALTQSLGVQEPYLSQKGGLAGFPNVNFANFQSMSGRGENFWRSQTTEVLDNVTWMKGKNQFKWGVDFRKNYANYTTCCRYDFGGMSFDGFASGFDYADFLLGIPHSTSLSTRNRPTVPRYNQVGLYALDDIQVNRRLTVNLGLRWDYQSPITEKYGQSYAMDLTSGNLILANSNSKNLVSPIFTASLPSIKYEIAPIQGFPANSLLDSHPNDWAPRVSFAYRPFSNDRTVVRGGYGIYYTQLTYTVDGTMGTGPFISSQSFTNTITNGVPLLTLPNPFLATGGIGTQSVGTVLPGLPFPMTQQWNLTVQHEFPGSMVVQVDYRGMHTQNLPYLADWNKPYPSTNPAGEKFFRYPNYYTVSLTQPGANQSLNALDMSVSRQFAQGLTFQSSYTYAKNLTDTSPTGEGAGNFIQNPYDRAVEWGNVSYMPTQRWVSYWVYDLPFGSGRRFASSLSPVLNRIVGGWEVSGVVNFQTGLWLTPSFNSFDPSNTRTFGGRPDQIGPWGVSNPTINRWFNPAAFAIPGCPNATPACGNPAAVGRFGNAANGIIESPGLSNLDFGLFKSFKIRERYTLRVGAEASNFFNHPNFGNPNTDISSVNVGTISSLNASQQTALGGDGGRAIQLQARLDF
ncbi:MAG: carboxypeptidase regulatory-like domain-containing protein [Terriglobia bacterium]